MEKTLDPRNQDHIEEIAAKIKVDLSLHTNEERRPTVGIVCGSGFRAIMELMDLCVDFPFNTLPGFPNTIEVEGHLPILTLARLKNTEVFVLVLQGRLHPYEFNMDMAFCAVPIRVMAILGVTKLILTNATGAINMSYRTRDYMLMRDHIFLPGLAGMSPLAGITDARMGIRFVAIDGAYDRKVNKALMEFAKSQDELTVHEGVYVMQGGPEYETTAELNYLRMVGADCVGMSVCHEAIVAKQLNMRLIGISMITNDLHDKEKSGSNLNHKDVLAVGTEVATNTKSLIQEAIKLMAADVSE